MLAVALGAQDLCGFAGEVEIAGADDGIDGAVAGVVLDDTLEDLSVFRKGRDIDGGAGNEAAYILGLDVNVARDVGALPGDPDVLAAGALGLEHILQNVGWDGELWCVRWHLIHVRVVGRFQ